MDMKRLCNFLFAIFICTLLLIVAPIHLVYAPIVTGYHWGGSYFAAFRFELMCVRNAIKREYKNCWEAGIFKLS